jgi:hypothetical protein
MPITVKKQGWPLMSIDTPEEYEKLKRAKANAETALPVIFETEIDGKSYRIRGYIGDGETSGSVCEWLWQGEWKRMRNYEIMERLKNLFKLTFNA